MVTDASNVPRWGAANYAFDRAVMGDTMGRLNLGLPGEYYDAQTGFWYNGFRDYDSRVGQYLQSDPIGLAGGLNTYAYVGGNPIRWVDPLGLQSETNNWIEGRMNGNPENPSLGDAMALDTLRAWGESIRTVFVNMPTCTLVCAADATVGVTPSSFLQNRVEDTAFKLADKAATRAIDDVSNACLSKTATRVGAKLASRVTPGVNAVAAGTDAISFGRCALKCGP